MTILTSIRFFVLVLICPLQFKQGVLTILAAYMRQRGDENGAVLLEKTADKFNEIRKKCFGRKSIEVKICCECGELTVATSGHEVKPSNWGCREVAHIHPTLDCFSFLKS